MNVRFAAARVAALATVDSTGRPHVVPVTFVVLGADVWTVVDAKPKRTKELRRLANVRGEPRVSLLAQHWDEDWAQLWWVRVDGRAVVVDDVPGSVVDALRAKYPQYSEVALVGPGIRVAVETVREWDASPPRMR